MEVKIKNIEIKLKELGLTANGRTQLFATEEAKRLMNFYVPVKNHGLRQSARTVDNGTAIMYQTPYAHYQYKGILYVDPITGKGAMFSKNYGFWSRPGVDKIPSNKKLKYTNPNASKEWDKKMMIERGKEYIQSVQQFFDKEFKK